MAHKIDSIIFDLDGTLVDSQPAALGSTVEALSRFGVDVTDTEIREQFGGGARKILRHFLERDLNPHEAEEVIEDVIGLRSDLQLSYTDRVILLPQVERLLESLIANGYRLKASTSDAPAEVASQVRASALRTLFG